MIEKLVTVTPPESLTGRQQYGDQIRVQKGGAVYPPPKSHFLLYVRETSGPLDTRRMFDPRITDIAESEKWLFHLAKGPNPTPAYLGQGFRNMMWRHPCYITIVLDNDDYYFNYNGNLNDPEGEPIKFRNIYANIPYDPNYSFYNARVVQIPILDANGNDTGQRRNGIRFENHVKADANGTDLARTQLRSYKMDLVVWEPVAGEPHVLKTTDPDGQNQGPASIP